MSKVRSDDSLSPIEPSAFQPLGSDIEEKKSPIHPLRWVLGITALTFVLVMGFLLTASSLQIIVESESEADVSISGLALPFGARYLLRPGDYTVTAQAQGYHPFETTITVTGSDSQSATLVLQPLPGLITVATRPDGARVLVDGEPLGDTPLNDLALEAGERVIKLEADRYLPHEQVFEVTGRQLPQQLSVDLQPAWAEFTVNSNPTGADILVDGEIVAVTPAVVEILQGDHQLMLQQAKFASWQKDLAVTAGQAQDLGTIELQPATGLLQLSSSPSGANVTLDGEFQGQTPLDLEITPDQSHRLAVFKPGYRRHSETVEMGAAATESRTISLRAQLGEVKFRISPSNAALRVNGQSRGKGSQVLSLPAVAQRVEISLDGYASVKRTVTPRPGLQQLVEVTLQTAAEAKAARIKPELTTALGQTLLLFNPADSPTANFSMGASRREPGRRANEVLHPVALSRSFYLQTTEVTNAQFRLFTASHDSGQIEGNSLNRDHQPVVQVSWQQAAAFSNWLSKREGLPPFYRETNGIITGYNRSSTGYRLPTETEWAWAARSNGESLLKFPWGENFPPSTAVENYADSTSAYVTGRVLSAYKDGYVVSAPVASFPASNKRLYDLGGNVAEWVHDVYSIPSANGSLQIDPLGAQSGDNFVIRGASWSHSRIAELRLSYRDYGQAGRDDVGFRLARYAE